MRRLHLALARRGWLHESDVPVDVAKLDDWVLPARLMAGGRVSERDTAARKVAVDCLSAQGLSADWIAERTGMTERTVVRLRARPVSGRVDPMLVRVLGWRPQRAATSITATRRREVSA